MIDAKKGLKQTVMLVDAEYIDEVAEHLRAHFSTELGREVQKADLAEWLVCCALDAGITSETGSLMAIFLHNPETKGFRFFQPSTFRDQLDGMAFYDKRVGEFQLSCISHEHLGNDSLLLEEAVKTILADTQVRRFILVTNANKIDAALEESKKEISQKEQFCLFSMQPSTSVNHTESPGFSLLHALNISAEEIHRK